MRRHTRHTLTSTAPPQALYHLASDVGRWPALFVPSVAADYLERGELTERFRLWASVGGEVKTWVSRRALDPLSLRIRFDQEESAPPIASMGGEWIFEAREDGGTDIVLLHDFTAVGDAPDAVEWINAALDRNSPVELAALARAAELATDHEAEVGDLLFTFNDTVTLDRTTGQVYEFVHRADLWPERLPHVRRVELTEDAAGVQELEMDTVTADGSAHSTRSLRVCRAGERIAYKQLVPPRLLLGHSGVWEFTESGTGTESRVTAEHTVLIDPAAVPKVLGAEATLADARRYLREALGRNSRTTLELAAARTSI